MPGREREGAQGSPLALVGDGLRRIDILLNSKREDLVKRLREGNNAWEQRKKQHVVQTDADHSQARIEQHEDFSNSKQNDRRRPWLPRRDDTYSPGADNSDYLHQSPDSERELQVNSDAH